MPRHNKYWDLGFIVLLAAVTAALSTSRGLNADQILSYQAGLRHLAGQRLYEDFYLAHGPMAGWIFTFFLALAPTGGFALIAASSTLNVAAALAAWKITLYATENNRHSLWAGILTGIWFVPIFGSYYHDLLAYLFLFFAFQGWNAKRTQFTSLGGVFLAASFHSKQTVGAIGLVAFFGLRLLEERPYFVFKSRDRNFLAGFFFAHLGVLAVIAWQASLQTYFRYTFYFPYQYFNDPHNSKNPVRLIKVLVLPYLINPIRMINEQGMGRIFAYPLALAAYAIMVSCFFLRAESQKKLRLTILFFLISTLWCSSLLGRLYAHLFLGMGIALAGLFTAFKTRWWVEGATVLFYAVLGLGFVWHEHGHVHPTDDYYRNTDLYPIRIYGNEISALNHPIINYLKGRKEKIAFFGDNSSLAGLALRIAPLHPPIAYNYLTVPHKPNLHTAWQKEFISSLESKQITLIVTDFVDLDEPVPLIQNYFHEKFNPVLNSGGLSVLARNESVMQPVK